MNFWVFLNMLSVVIHLGCAASASNRDRVADTVFYCFCSYMSFTYLLAVMK